MPEIAEVAHIIDQLNHSFAGHTLKSVSFIGGRFKSNETIHLNLENTRFYSKGKFLYWTFNSDVVFFITLGMTGSFGKRSKHSAIEFRFDNDIIYFNDVRHFGTFKISNRKELNNKLLSLGWDPLKEQLTEDIKTFIYEKSKKKNKTISEFLLDQSVFCGCGNYLKSEILYQTKIHPNKLINELNQEHISKICIAFKEIAGKAYELHGASFRNYQDLNDKKGGFQNFFKVYRQKTDPDGNKVEKIVSPDGRSTYFVNFNQ